MAIKRAASVKIEFCDSCLDPHIILLDDHGEPFAEAVIFSEHGAMLIDSLQKVLYLKAALGEGDGDKKC